MNHTETRAMRLTVLPGMTDEVLRWLRKVLAHSVEALAGLSEEGILSESFFLERNPGSDSILYVVRANNIAEADRLFESSTRLLDVEARRFWDSHVQNAGTLELIADLTRNPRREKTWPNSDADLAHSCEGSS